ncbi:MAG: beta-N-acetylhexosaminidase [Chloroflexi bacterium]|nr:beta-N-acetylhexosaminidase [Chloroflexota bacterium]
MTLNIIPQPNVVTPGAGAFVVRAETRIHAAQSATAVAAYLDEWLRAATGHTLPIVHTPAEKQGIALELVAGSDLGSEGYTLSVNGDQVRITAETAQGLFYGVQTLRQLLPPDAETPSAHPVDRTIPAVDIEDRPRFAWRGLMLDVCRHFFPVSFVKKLLDTMALYKLNVLHWHLTDDQGWRIEIKSLPRLTEVGSRRSASTKPDKRSGSGEDLTDVLDGIPYGGFYTQEEIREVVAYAQSRFITVVPEIEMPGHSVAALTSYPELGCVGQGYEVRTTWGIADEVLCAGKESTYEYVEKVLSEVVDLFPSEIIHIGGDECPKARWRECPHCQAAIEREGLNDEHELQSYFVRRVEKILEAKGRRLIGWDEILEGGLAPKATVMSWRGAKGGIEAATAGHPVVMSPNTSCYLDYYQAEDQDSEPLAIFGFVPLRRAYAFDATEGVPADKAGFVLGGQGNLWTEYISTGSHAEYMLFPRALALADALWAAHPRQDYTEFFERLQSHLPRLDQLGVNYRQPKDADRP